MGARLAPLFDFVPAGVDDEEGGSASDLLNGGPEGWVVRRRRGSSSTLVASRALSVELGDRFAHATTRTV